MLRATCRCSWPWHSSPASRCDRARPRCALASSYGSPTCLATASARACQALALAGWPSARQSSPRPLSASALPEESPASRNSASACRSWPSACGSGHARAGLAGRAVFVGNAAGSPDGCRLRQGPDAGPADQGLDRRPWRVSLQLPVGSRAGLQHPAARPDRQQGHPAMLADLGMPGHAALRARAVRSLVLLAEHPAAEAFCLGRRLIAQPARAIVAAARRSGPGWPPACIARTGAAMR